MGRPVYFVFTVYVDRRPLGSSRVHVVDQRSEVEYGALYQKNLSPIKPTQNYNKTSTDLAVFSLYGTRVVPLG